MPAGIPTTFRRTTPKRLVLATAMCALCLFGTACAKAPLERDKPCWLEDSCAAPPLLPDANPTDLPFGAVIEGSLHCDEGDCQDWYRIAVGEDDRIQIAVRAGQVGGQGSVSLALLDERGAMLFRPERPSQRIDGRLEAGSYQLGVVAIGTRGRPLRYEVVAEQSVNDAEEAAEALSRAGGVRASGGAAARGAWAPSRSQRGWIRSEVLEVAADSVGVLIDAGTTQGLRTGQRGELVQSGQTIARIELVEVYEAGSRARLLAPAINPIDPLKTEARIHVAPASRAR